MDQVNQHTKDVNAICYIKKESKKLCCCLI